LRRNDLPTGGKSSINPESGEALKTSFTIITEGWNDEITDSNKLKYVFS
jgi:hypothetical protein